MVLLMVEKKDLLMVDLLVKKLIIYVGYVYYYDLSF
jgi:hypothetical protein